MILTVLATMPLTKLTTYPRQLIVDDAKLRIVGGHGDNAIVMEEGRLKKKYLVAESAEQINYLLNQSTYPYAPRQNIAAAGTTQGAATQITQLIAVVTSASAGSEGVKLPKANDDKIEQVYLVSNATGYPVKVWPSSGDFINEMAVDVAVTIPPSGIATFYVKYNPLAE